MTPFGYYGKERAENPSSQDLLIPKTVDEINETKIVSYFKGIYCPENNVLSIKIAKILVDSANVIYSNIICPIMVQIELTPHYFKILTIENAIIATINFISNIECVVLGSYLTFTVITPSIQIKFNTNKSWIWRIKIQYYLEQYESRSIFSIIDQVKSDINE